MKKPKIFIACDTTNPNVIRKIISHTKTDKLDIGYKLGVEFFYSKDGRKFSIQSSCRQLSRAIIITHHLHLDITLPKKNVRIYL